MRTMKTLIMLFVIVLNAAPALAQIDLPFEMYGDKVDILYPAGMTSSIIMLNSRLGEGQSSVSLDGQLYAQPIINYGADYIYMAAYPSMILAPVMNFDDIIFDFPANGIANLHFHPDNIHIIYQTQIYDPARGGSYISSSSGISRLNGLTTICMINTQTGEHEVLLEGGYPHGVSPDGRYLLYSVHDYRYYTIGPEAAVDNAEWALYDFVTRESILLRDIFAGESLIKPHYTTSIAFSPDGASIYFLTDTSGGNATHQLFKASLDGSLVEQVSNFVYSEVDSSDNVRLISIELSLDEEWAVITATAKLGRDYLLMYELASGRIFSLFTGEEISSDFHEMIEYQTYIADTYGDFDGFGMSYQESYSGTDEANMVYTINGVEYDYDEFHLVSPKFIGWHPDGETLVMYCHEIGGSGIYYKAFDPAFYKSSPTVVADAAPAVFPAIANYPNPFNPQTTLSFTLPTGGYTEVSVYNLAGQRIRELVATELAPGTHEVVWDGKDMNGVPVSSGVFFSQLKSGDTVVTDRMTLVK